MSLPVAGAPPPAFPYEFDPLTRAKARDYERGGRLLAVLGGTVLPAALALAFFATGASSRLAQWARSLAPASPAAGDAAYIAVFALGFALSTLPVAYYLGHVRERRFGLTERRAAAFLKDAAKGAAVATALALGLLLPFFYVTRRFDDWWVVATALYGGYLVVSAAVLPHLVLPLFYKVEPLPAGALRDAIVGAAAAAGLRPGTRIVVLQESAKSRRANAFVHGFGRTRRIVLYDTLVRSFHPREVAFTVAHEAGHIATRDVPKSAALSLAVVAPELFLLSVFLEALAPLGGARGATDVAVVPLLLAFVVGFGLATRPAFAALHRRSERRADAFALRATGDGAAAASMLRRVCDLNLMDDAPPRLVERLLHTHPSPERRIRDALAHGSASLAAPEGRAAG
ncbi:MAG TPA: M48 family metalloprotease [Candidatus Thermoplasmatota archaeon]